MSICRSIIHWEFDYVDHECGSSSVGERSNNSLEEARTLIAVLWMVCVALLTTSGLGAQERTAMRVSIGGASLPPDVQPRVIVEQQLGVVDQVRIQVMGSRGVGYAGAIAPGDDVDIVAFRLDGGSIPIFSGHVVSLERGFDESQPFVVIRAASALPRGDSRSGKSVILTTRSDAGVKLVTFLPRLSAASSVQEVVVTGVDSSTGGQSIGRAVAPTILLGAGSRAPFGARLMIDTDRRFSSADEANAFAWSVLSELVATRISAEALTAGDPEIGIGSFVEVEGLDEEFDAPVLRGRRDASVRARGVQRLLERVSSPARRLRNVSQSGY